MSARLIGVSGKGAACCLRGGAYSDARCAVARVLWSVFIALSLFVSETGSSRDYQEYGSDKALGSRCRRSCSACDVWFCNHSFSPGPRIDVFPRIQQTKSTESINGMDHFTNRQAEGAAWPWPQPHESLCRAVTRGCVLGIRGEATPSCSTARLTPAGLEPRAGAFIRICSESTYLLRGCRARHMAPPQGRIVSASNVRG